MSAQTQSQPGESRRARSLARVLGAQATQDGAGVRLLRALGAKRHLRMDPFLMLDAFSSDDPNDYIAGFPPHPHRGFETITYIVDGHMRHRDHLGNEGDLKAGGVQWMTAGRGIIHEEMPQQEDGLLRGFQIWLNLPAKDKMQPAHYEDIAADALPVAQLAGDGFVKLIAGRLNVDDNLLQAPELGNPATQPIIADIRIDAGQQLELAIPQTHSVLAYVFEGALQTDDQTIPSQYSAWFNNNADTLTLAPAPEGPRNGHVRLLLLAGVPLNEPIAQYGPFVMNTTEEIEQALQEYRDGTLTASPA